MKEYQYCNSIELQCNVPRSLETRQYFSVVEQSEIVFFFSPGVFRKELDKSEYMFRKSRDTQKLFGKVPSLFEKKHSNGTSSAAGLKNESDFKTL